MWLSLGDFQSQVGWSHMGTSTKHKCTSWKSEHVICKMRLWRYNNTAYVGGSSGDNRLPSSMSRLDYFWVRLCWKMAIHPTRCHRWTDAQGNSWCVQWGDQCVLQRQSIRWWAISIPCTFLSGHAPAPERKKKIRFTVLSWRDATSIVQLFTYKRISNCTAAENRCWILQQFATNGYCSTSVCSCKTCKSQQLGNCARHAKSALYSLIHRSFCSGCRVLGLHVFKLE